MSSEEANSIKSTGAFSLNAGGMECKQFGMNYAETKEFGNQMGQSIVVKASIPTQSISSFYYSNTIDTGIFKSGTLTVYGDKLSLFNSLVQGTIEIME